MGKVVDSGVTTRRWRRAEYDRLVDLGMFVGERLELLDGVLVVREPQGSGHAAVVVHVGQVLSSAFGSGWHARLQAPLALSDDSEPEPDVAIVAGAALDYVNAHPGTAALIVEVADASLRLDRRFKAELYARARVPEYWIVNLVDRAIEVHREPVAVTDIAGDRERESVHDAVFDARYRSVLVVRPPDVLTPLAAPAARIPAADLLP